MATMRINIVPFPVPTGVVLQQPPGRREDGFRPAQELPLSRLDRETVEQLCDEFKATVLQRWEESRVERPIQPHWHDVPPTTGA